MCSDSVRNSLISFSQVCSLALNVLQCPLVGCLLHSKALCVWSLRIQSVTISLFKCECWKTKLRSWCVYSEVIECVLHTPRITLTTCQLEWVSEQFYETVPKSKCKSKDNTMIIMCNDISSDTNTALWCLAMLKTPLERLWLHHHLIPSLAKQEFHNCFFTWTERGCCEWVWFCMLLCFIPPW